MRCPWKPVSTRSVIGRMTVMRKRTFVITVKRAEAAFDASRAWLTFITL